MGKLLNWKLKKNSDQHELLHMTYVDRDLLIEAINKLVDAACELEDKVDRNELEIRELKLRLINYKLNDSL